MDGVDLEFEDGALKEIAHEALKRGTGARALRGIIEAIMLDVMFEVPSRPESIERVIVPKNVLSKGVEPIIVVSEERQAS